MFRFLLPFIFLVGVSAKSNNTFFVVNDSMSIDCTDIIEVDTPTKWGIRVMLNEKGNQKFYKIFRGNIGKDLGLKVGDKVIFFNATIRASALEKGLSKYKTLSTRSLEDAELLKESFGTCK